MTCREVQKLLDAYLDGELDLVHNLEIERHLQDCVACQSIYQNYQTLRKDLKGGSLYYQLPGELPKKIRSSLRKAVPRPATPGFHLESQSRRRLVISASVGFMVMVLLLSGGLVYLLNSTSRQTDLLSQEVLDSHIRSLLVDHLADVISTDQHTVKPWFDGKLDFSPVVVDLADKGYPLTGGRLDYLEQHPVAALVYQRGKHIINVFSWPEGNPNAREAVQVTTLQGYHLFHWIQSGWNYWVVSDLGETDLGTFVNLLQRALVS
jgi:anti-sigma factor RsiW